MMQRIYGAPRSILNAPPNLVSLQNAQYCKDCQIRPRLADMNGREINGLERQRIEMYLKGRWGVRQIARSLKRNHGVISREIERNSKPNGEYSSVYAQICADKRRVRRGNVKRKLDKNDVLKDYVVNELKQGFAPDVIAGRLKLISSPALQGETISHEAIYQWLYEGEGNEYGYWQNLPNRRRKRKKHGSRNRYKGNMIKDRVSIHERGEGIDDRIELGHWETDSVIYNGSGGEILSVQTERKARFLQMHRLPSKSAKDTLDALQETISSVPQDLIKTITFDNGSEGARHYILKQDYNIDTYFCDTYSSWQKGTVENMNGLIRRHLPRGTDLRRITDHQIYEIQTKLNNTPRKILNYRTPTEVMFNLPPKVVH